MKLIVITQPEFFEDEAAAITSLFDAGLEILHLRKPGASYEDMDKFCAAFRRNTWSASLPTTISGLHPNGT